MTLQTRLPLLKTSALAALMLGMGLPVFADNLTAWNNQRAELFSKVCVGSAPSFAKFEQTAKNAGFKFSGPDLLFEPEVVVSIVNTEGGCLCQMTVGAPDQAAMIESVLNTVFNDFKDSLDPSKDFGNAFPIRRDGHIVEVQFHARTYDDAPWILATATTQMACPK